MISFMEMQSFICCFNFWVPFSSVASIWGSIYPQLSVVSSFQSIIFSVLLFTDIFQLFTVLIVLVLFLIWILCHFSSLLTRVYSFFFMWLASASLTTLKFPRCKITILLPFTLKLYSRCSQQILKLQSLTTIPQFLNLCSISSEAFS